MAIGPQRVEAAFENIRAKRIDDQVDALAAGEFMRRLDEVLGASVDDTIGAEGARAVALARSTHRADDLGADPLEHLGQHQADGATDGVHQDELALAHVIGAARQVIGGQRDHREGRAEVEREFIGQADDVFRRRRDPVGEAADATGADDRRDPLAGLDAAHAAPLGDDVARYLAAEDHRVGDRIGIDALALLYVAPIAAGVRDADENLAGPGFGRRHVLQLELLRAAWAFDNYRAHRSGLSSVRLVAGHKWPCRLARA